jgi:hypothetical protein
VRFETRPKQKKTGLFASIRRGVAKVVGAKLKEDIFGGANFLVEPDDPDGRIYRELGRKGARRTIPSHLMDEASRQSFKLLIENPYIKRISNIRADFIVGKGIEPKSESDMIVDEIMSFWSDKANGLDKRQHQYAMEFGTYGELAWERLVNRESGRMRINPRDPLEIGRVEGHPTFDLIPWRMFFKVQGGEIPATILNTLPPDLVEVDPRVANVYYFRSNQMTGNLRGVSDYYDMLEWADSLDAAAWSMLERMNQLITYIWHLKVTNLKPEDKTAFKNFLENARPSSAFVSEKDVELDAKTPDLKSADYSGGADWIKSQLAMSGGIQPNWIGLAGEANIGEAASMDQPVFRTLARKQGEYLDILRTVTDDYLRQRVVHGTLAPTVKIGDDDVPPWKAYTLHAEPVSKREMGQVANVAASLGAALGNALNEGWITTKEGAQVFRSVVSELSELSEELPEGIAQETGIPNMNLDAFKGLSDRLAPNGNGSMVDARSESGR